MKWIGRLPTRMRPDIAPQVDPNEKRDQMSKSTSIWVDRLKLALYIVVIVDLSLTSALWLAWIRLSLSSRVRREVVPPWLTSSCCCHGQRESLMLQLVIF